MMHKAPGPLSTVALLCCLSCSIWQPPERPPRPAPYTAPATVDAEVFGPTAVEWVEARFWSYQPTLSPEEIRAVAESVVEESERNGLSWDLVLAVIHTESGFYNFAVSNVGALGLMQIMPQTGETVARWLQVEWDGPDTLFRPRVNVKLGTRYLAWLYSRYRNWDRALAAYNWGPTRIDYRLTHGKALPAEYVQRVMAQVQSPVAP